MECHEDVVRKLPRKFFADLNFSDCRRLTEIMRLPRKRMEVVMLYYYEGLTIREIAEALGVSLSAASQRLSKAKSKLHDALGGGGGYER